MKPLRIRLLSGYKDRPAPGLHVRAPRDGAQWLASEAYFRRPPNVRRENAFWRPKQSWRGLPLTIWLTFLSSLDLIYNSCFPSKQDACWKMKGGRSANSRPRERRLSEPPARARTRTRPGELRGRKTRTAENPAAASQCEYCEP